MENEFFEIVKEAVKSSMNISLPYSEKISAAAIGLLVAIKNYQPVCGDRYAYYMFMMEEAIEKEYKKKYAHCKVESDFSLDKTYGEKHVNGNYFLRTSYLGPEDRVISRMFREVLSYEENCFMDALIRGETLQETENRFGWSLEKMERIVITIQEKYYNYCK